MALSWGLRPQSVHIYRDVEFQNRKTTEEEYQSCRVEVTIFGDEDIEGSHKHAGKVNLEEVNIK